MIQYKNNIPHLPKWAEDALQSAMDKTGIRKVLITSTKREPVEQAMAMYDNIKNYGVKKQKILYGKNGDRIIDVYERNKKLHYMDVVMLMAAEIVQIGKEKISQHMVDDPKLSVFDIAPYSIESFDGMVGRLIYELGISKHLVNVIKPPKDPALHLELQKI
jgi:hypothetical protein